MPSRLALLRLVGILLLTGAVTGCAVTGERSDPAAKREPRMPTVTPRPALATVAVADAAVIAAAQRHLQANDLVAARRTLDEVYDAAQRTRIAHALTTQLAAQDPARAAEFALALREGVGRLTAVEIAAEAWATQSPDAALRWARGLVEPAVAGVARRAVAHRLVQSEPRAAIDQILAMPDEPGRNDLLGFAVASWARRDADAALAWLGPLPENELKQRLTSTVGFEVSQHRPDRAVALAERLPEGRNRWLLMSSIAQTWVATDPKAALAWAGRLPEGEARSAAFAGLDTGLGMPSARRSISAPGARGVRSRGFGGSVGEAALTAGASADFEAWRSTQPGGRSLEEEIVEYVQQRGATDSGAIGQWLTSLAPGPARDRAMEIYLDGQLIGSPQRAASWLRSMPRSDRSDAMIERTARAWLQTSPDAAQAWLLETPLPPDRKERLLRDAGR